MKKEYSRWPDFYIVGTPRGGTTYLYSILKSHPEICLPREKELKFFSLLANSQSSVSEKNKREYLQHFGNPAQEIYIGETSPDNLHTKGAAALIKSINDKAKIIISLRDPIERLISHILMVKRNEGVETSVESFVSSTLEKNNHFMLKQGLYTEHVQRYLSTFGANNVHIIVFEEWIQEPLNTINEILKFIGTKTQMVKLPEKEKNGALVHKNALSKFLLSNGFLKRTSRSLLTTETRLKIKRRFLKEAIIPTLGPETIEKLHQFYKSDVDRLQGVLGRKLPWKYF